MKFIIIDDEGSATEPINLSDIQVTYDGVLDEAIEDNIFQCHKCHMDLLLSKMSKEEGVCTKCLEEEYARKSDTYMKPGGANI